MELFHSSGSARQGRKAGFLNPDCAVHRDAGQSSFECRRIEAAFRIHRTGPQRWRPVTEHSRPSLIDSRKKQFTL
jgi:hypothetical protein